MTVSTPTIDIHRFQGIAAGLLKKHYGLDLNDTALSDTVIVGECINEGSRPFEAVAEIAKECNLSRIDKMEHGLFSSAGITAEDEDVLIQKLFAPNDRYADRIIDGHPELYDAIEVHGVRNAKTPDDPQGACIEVDDENPEFFSVYLHLVEGGCDCVGDFHSRELADAYAEELRLTYSW